MTDLRALSDAATDVRKNHAPNEWDSCVACQKQWPCDAEMLAELVMTRLSRLAASPSPDTDRGEPRWAEWARYIAPLVHDGLIDTPNERQINDKAFAIARLLDDVLPSPVTDAGLDVERLARAIWTVYPFPGSKPSRADIERVAAEYARLATPEKGQSE